MINLFHINSSCSTAVKAALSIVGENYSVNEVDLSAKTDEFIIASPLGKVPVVSLDNTSIMEGGAINMWLSARNPEAGLMPALDTMEGAEALKWLFYAYGTIHPVWVRIFFPARFANEDAIASVKKMAVNDLFKLYALIDERLSNCPYLAGDRLSLADLYFAATIHWEASLDEKLTLRFPSIAAHRDRVIAQPGVKAAFAGEFGYAQTA